MAVAFDAKGTSDVYGSSSPLDFANLTVGSGANRALVVTLGFDVDPGVVTCHWDSAGTNQSMTQIIKTVSPAPGFTSLLFGLVAPTSGAKNLHVTFTNAVTDCYIDAISFTGVDQTGGATTFYNSASGTTSSGTNITITITSATIGAAVANVAGSSVLTQTSIYLDGQGSNVICAGAYNIGSASVAFTASSNQTTAALVGVAIKAAVAAPFSSFPFGISPLPKPGSDWTIFLPNLAAGLLTQATPSGSFEWLDGHPPLPKPPEVFVPTNLLPGLLTQPGLNFAFVPYDWSAEPHLPPAWLLKPPEVFVPNNIMNILLAPPVGFPTATFLPFDFNRHPPVPPHGPEWWHEVNLLPALLTQPGLNLAFIPHAWGAEPHAFKIATPSEVIFPNIVVLNITNPTLDVMSEFRRPLIFTNPPQAWRFPDPIFPNVTLSNPTFDELINFRTTRGFTSPPISYRLQDWYWQNYSVDLQASVLVGPYDQNEYIVQYRHPPQKWQSPDFIFPNIPIRVPPLPVLQLTTRPYDFYERFIPPRHPVEFIFPNGYLLKTIPGPTPVPPAPFIRNAAAVLQDVRQGKATLTAVRQSGYTLEQVRATPSKLDK